MSQSQYYNDQSNQAGQNQQELLNTMKGNVQNLASDQTPATNARTHYQIVDGILEIAQKELSEFKNEVEDTRTDMGQMKVRLGNQQQEIKNMAAPTIEALYRDLKQAIASQKDENSKLQNQITELKKEKSQIQQLVIQSVQKVAFLESSIGNY